MPTPLPEIQIELFTQLAIFFNGFIIHILRIYKKSGLPCPSSQCFSQLFLCFSRDTISCVNLFHHSSFRVFSSGNLHIPVWAWSSTIHLAPNRGTTRRWRGGQLRQR